MKNGVLTFYGEEYSEVVVPDGVCVIDNGVFCGCFEIHKINIPDSVRAIREKAFYGCKNLQTVRCLGNPVISKKAFYNTPFGANKQHEEMLWTNYLR